MEKLELLKTISRVHSRKCMLLSNFSKALESFDMLTYLKSEVENAEVNQLEQIVTQIKTWADSKPQVNID
jgi:hypothetical protein